MNRSLACARASSRSCRLAVPASMRVFVEVRFLLGDFVFELSDISRGLHLRHRALQAQSLLRNLILGRFRLLLRLKSVGIGGLGPRTLRRVEEWETNANAHRRIVLLKAVWSRTEILQRGHAGFRRDVIVLKVVELGKQGILRGEIDARPRATVLAPAPADTARAHVPPQLPPQDCDGGASFVASSCRSAGAAGIESGSV